MGIIVAILLAALALCAAIIIAAVASGATQKDTKSVMVFTFFGSTATAAVIAGITLYDLAKLWLGFTPYPVDVSIYPWWPEALDLHTTNGLTLTNNGLTTLRLETSSLPVLTQLLFSVSIIFTGLMHIWLCMAVRSVALHYLRGSAFRPVVAKIIHSLAWVLLICGLLGPVLEAFAIIHVGGSISGSGIDAVPDGFDASFIPETSQHMIIPIHFWPIGAFLALYVLAAVLKDGEKLEESTEGLV